MNSVKSDLIKVMKHEPCVTYFGFETMTNAYGYNINRERLLKHSIKAFQICCDFLSRCRRRKTVNQSIGTSYGLKHAVEAWSGRYISNGAFIAAAIHLRIPYKTYFDSPNVYIALSSRCSFLKRCLDLSLKGLRPMA